MSKCGAYWHKVQIIEEEIKQVEQYLYKANIDLQNNPASLPLKKYQKELEDKRDSLNKKRNSAYNKAVACEAKQYQKENPMG